MRAAAATLLLILAGLLAGCQSPPAATTAATDNGSSTDAVLVRGWVLAADESVVETATVTALGFNLTIQPDPTGHYEIASLPTDGTAIVLVAEAEGYEPVSKSVIPVVGSILIVNFTLEPKTVLLPSKQTKEFTGLLACQAALITGEDRRHVECGADDPKNAPRWDFTVDAHTAGVIIEVQWEPGTPAARQLNLTVETVGYGDLDEVLANSEGESVLRAQVNSLQAARFYSQGGIIRVTMSAGGDPDADETGVAASAPFQQAFRVVATIFYVAPADPTYTAF